MASGTADIEVAGWVEEARGIDGEIAFALDAGLSPYRGPYAVTPRADPQSLATRGARMLCDVEVDGIPIARTGNESNGYTITIG